MALSMLWTAPVAAQQIIPPSRHEYLDSTRHVLPGELNARYRRDTEYVDSVGGSEKSYYLPTGRLASQQAFDNLRKRVPHGVSEWWYPGGQLRMHEEFLHGKMVGELRMYYPGGQLKRREIFNPQDDFASSGECFAENGQPIPFFKYEQMPVYSQGDGGSRVIVTAIQRGMKYPRAALKAGCAGRVIVAFNVTAEGEVADIRIVQGVCAAIDEAVMDAVRRLKHFKPGLQDGVPVAVGYTVPVTFAIQ